METKFIPTNPEELASFDSILKEFNTINDSAYVFTNSYDSNYDVYVGSESTADGYEVWVATYGDGRSVCINEDVHYYDNDLAEKLVEAMTDYNELIYVDDLEAYFVQDAIMQVYDSYVNDIKQEVENELIEEGYEYEKTD